MPISPTYHPQPNIEADRGNRANRDRSSWLTQRDQPPIPPATYLHSRSPFRGLGGWPLGGWPLGVFALFLSLLTLASCSGADTPMAESNTAPLTIGISCADGAMGRAVSYTGTADATEGIYDWFVVLCQGDNVTYVIDGNSGLGGVKEDGLTTDDEYPTGTYTAYSFANVSAADLGITSSTTASQIEEMTIATNGNLIDLSTTAHIPMTNVETVTFDSKGMADHDLHVVRL